MISMTFVVLLSLALASPIDQATEPGHGLDKDWQEPVPPVPMKLETPEPKPQKPAPMSAPAGKINNEQAIEPAPHQSPIEAIKPQGWREGLEFLPPAARAVNEFPGHPACDLCTCRKRCNPDGPRAGLPQAPPNGYYVRQFQTIQVAKAQANRFVIYLHEWYRDGMELGPYGKRHLDRIAEEWSEMPFPVILEKGRSPEVDQKRKDLIVKVLVESGLSDAPIRVSVGYTKAEGINGEEAAQIYRNGVYYNFGNNGFGNFGAAGAGRAFNSSNFSVGLGGGFGIGGVGFGGAGGIGGVGLLGGGS
jgi:hypothetical protein